MTRVVVFVDYQNVYHSARDAFGVGNDDPVFGHVRPIALGLLLRQLGESVDASRELVQVRVYRGEPGNRSHPTLVASFQRQVAEWRRHEILHVVTRPLRYNPTAWDATGRPTRWDTGREKGIDVLIALDMVLGAVRDEYDTAILASGDTDLIPAIDEVIGVGKRVENAVWWPETAPGRPLRASSSRKLWVHRLDRAKFDVVRDTTNWVSPAR